MERLNQPLHMDARHVRLPPQRNHPVPLYLWNLNLSGTLSPDLAQLRFLSNLSVSQNRLSGQIPTELGTLVSLKYMDLSTNMLTGEIPLSFEISLLDLMKWYWLNACLSTYKNDFL